MNTELPQKPRRRWLLVPVIFLAFLLVLAGGTVVWMLWITRDLPDEKTIKRYRPYVSTEVRGADGQLILSLSKNQNRLWKPLSSISPRLVEAVITAEDDTFFEHDGVRPEQIRKAFWDNLDAGRYKRGGSTITQQLAKNAFLSREKTLTRKVKEYFLARRIEKVLPKKRILELYLNLVEWGQGIYGAETAARHYFNKPARALNLAEGALLAGMLPNPRYYNPFERPDKVREKQKWVLDLMLHNKVIDADEHRAALQAPIALRQQPPRARGPDCFEKTLTDYLEKRLGAERLYRGGSMILTDLKSSAQQELERRFEKQPGGLLLVAREGDSVRAFICIGDSPPAVEPDLPFVVEVMSKSDFFKEDLLGRPDPE
jgi:monofunctional biosynthetic peptidoglycan transglycosylase